MVRPYIICHMVTSIDGKVTGDFLFRPECAGATETYYRLNRELRANGFICGRIYRRIIEQAYEYLNQDGYLCLEIGYDQKEEVIKLIKETNHYQEIYSKKDLAGNDRIVVCENCQKSIE